MISKAVGMECRACDSHPTQSARNLVSHPLDRCVWSSLTTRHAAEAIGNPRALRYHPDYGPFAAAADSFGRKSCRFVSACAVQRTDLHRGGGGNRNDAITGL